MSKKGAQQIDRGFETEISTLLFKNELTEIWKKELTYQSILMLNLNFNCLLYQPVRKRHWYQLSYFSWGVCLYYRNQSDTMPRILSFSNNQKAFLPSRYSEIWFNKAILIGKWTFNALNPRYADLLKEKLSNKIFICKLFH